MGEKALNFRLKESDFSISLANLNEVLHKFDRLKMPDPPRFFKGTLNLRGAIMSIYDLSEALTGKKIEVEPLKTCVLVLNIEEHKFGVLVDEVLDVYSQDKSSLEKLDEALSRKYHGLVTEVEHREDGIVLKVNVGLLKEFFGYGSAAWERA